MCASYIGIITKQNKNKLIKQEKKEIYDEYDDVDEYYHGSDEDDVSVALFYYISHENAS